ncbi:hypothetical protein A4A58_19390 [Tardiphaga robiniae]|uniref:Uncharacterized protein n=1 Tax=Tardiphaga robiniae TaxID=943830 RepID=A0A163X4E4_9BRAD|nr:hypothetical protein A4A58_19390 [Tardiphaga robiniae]
MRITLSEKEEVAHAGHFLGSIPTMTALLNHYHPVAIAPAAVPSMIAAIFRARAAVAAVIVAGHSVILADANAHVLRTCKGRGSYGRHDGSGKCVS